MAEFAVHSSIGILIGLLVRIMQIMLSEAAPLASFVIVKV